MGGVPVRALILVRHPLWRVSGRFEDIGLPVSLVFPGLLRAILEDSQSSFDKPTVSSVILVSGVLFQAMFSIPTEVD
jgi:hypothetical protein